MEYVNNFGVTNVRTVFFKSNAKKENFCIFYKNAFFVHQLNDLVGNIVAHTVIKPSGIRHDSW